MPLTKILRAPKCALHSIEPGEFSVQLLCRFVVGFSSLPHGLEVAELVTRSLGVDRCPDPPLVVEDTLAARLVVSARTLISLVA